MTVKPFWIADYKAGLENDVEPWKMIEDAFIQIDNLVVYRGKVQKCKKPVLLGRLQREITAEVIGDKAAHYIATLTNVPIVPGSIVLTDAGFGQVVTDDSEGNLIGDVDPTGTNTVNYLTGDIDVTFLAATGAVTADYEYYPLLPVMGIHMRETSTTNVEETIFFDRSAAYVYNGVLEKFETINTVNQAWTGSDSQFFAAYNYLIQTTGVKLFWATNFKAYNLAGAVHQDGIKYYDGTTWATLHPIIYVDGGNKYLNGCKIIIAFKSRLIVMNTIEEAVNYQNRVRWCALGDPTTANQWRSDIKGKGGYLDSTLNQSIQSATIINNKLIVGFERGYRELAYTGISSQPFEFRDITDEYGSESQFSTQVIGSNAITYGQRAITATDGVRIERIDAKIPEEIFLINNLQEGKERVQSVRDYIGEFIYWAIPQGENKYPNKILIFNYKNGSYSYAYNHFTALGQFQRVSEYKWSEIGKKWSECGFKWSDAISRAESPIIAGGNQRGYVHLLNFLTIEDPSLDVSAVDTANLLLTCTNHNLPISSTQYITLSNLLGITGYDPTKIYKAIPKDANTIQIVTLDVLAGTYIGGGSIAILSPFSFVTKRFNPFVETGRDIKCAYVDIFIDMTDYGQITANVYGDETNSDPIATVENLPTSYQGYNRPDAIKAWKRIEVHGSANSIQIEVGITEDQLLSSSGRQIYEAEFKLHAMRLWVAPSGKNIGVL